MIVRSVGLLLLLSVFIAVGCSTPQSRAKEHADLFASYPPQVQARLEAGQPAVGDTKEMVYIALGEPDTILTRTERTGTDQAGVVYDIWSYDGVYYTRDSFWRQPSIFRKHRRHGYDYFYSGPQYVDVQHEYERLRIEFDDGKVKAIEQKQR